MPKAIFNPDNVKRFDLKSCPEGFVVIRRHSYGHNLERRQMAVDTQISKAANGKEQADVTMNVLDTTLFDFANCIVEHNLEDDAGTLLNFKLAGHVSALDGAIGEEIATYIESFNNWEKDLGNLTTAS